MNTTVELKSPVDKVWIHVNKSTGKRKTGGTGYNKKTTFYVKRGAAINNCPTNHVVMEFDLSVGKVVYDKPSNIGKTVRAKYRIASQGLLNNVVEKGEFGNIIEELEGRLFVEFNYIHGGSGKGWVRADDVEFVKGESNE